ncbi:hypothetical protein JRO89_XS06G0021100 [Xanthoceras sorbifolium]|uniref:THH1/TOM1/TOM3 domain-containing protein n=1 Tax=Xanthoceras sorbifolium TaxID=99658 RepID=A0ABQ8HWJ7_9ROSI|nr:hypothetical protein JRO89_XS06G0021100 [Xanthoceras sorbifolium]
MYELQAGSCFPGVLVGVNVGLACVDGIIAILAFTQDEKMLVSLSGNLSLLSSEDSLTEFTTWLDSSKSKAAFPIVDYVFHLLIGSSNIGYLIYFAVTLVAACNGWLCWSYSCGFVAMAFPRVDLCHQADDEEEEDEEYGFLEALLLNKSTSSNPDSHRICYPFQSIHVGSRQKIVILVTVLVFVLMMTFAVVIWIGMGDNPINSSLVAQVYVALFSIAILLLGGALACYGLLLCLKMRTVRSETASSEMWKVAGLAVVSVVCFTPSAFIALLTEIPDLYHWNQLEINIVYTSILLIAYYFVVSLHKRLHLLLPLQLFSLSFVFVLELGPGGGGKNVFCGSKTGPTKTGHNTDLFIF